MDMIGCMEEARSNVEAAFIDLIEANAGLGDRTVEDCLHSACNWLIGAVERLSAALQEV